MSNLYSNRREEQPDFVVGINLPMSAYLQMSTGLVIVNTFSSTEGQYSGGQMREAEQLWRRIVLLSWFIVNNEQLAFISFLRTTRLWRRLWKLCTGWLISFHCLRSGCSLKLTDWLGATLRCCHCLDLCKKATLDLPFWTSPCEVINILSDCSSSNRIRAVISISRQQRGESWTRADTRLQGFSTLPQLSWFKKMAALKKSASSWFVSLYFSLHKFSLFVRPLHLKLLSPMLLKLFMHFKSRISQWFIGNWSLDGQLLPSLWVCEWVTGLGVLPITLFFNHSDVPDLTSWISYFTWLRLPHRVKLSCAFNTDESARVYMSAISYLGEKKVSCKN